MRNDRIGASGFSNQRCELALDLESMSLVQMLKIVLQPYLTKAHLVVTSQGVPAAAFRSPSGERQRTFACRKPCPDAQLLLRKWAGDRP
jgi:hypothetical protein